MSWLHAGNYSAHINPITSEVKKRMMKGNSWRKGCPVGTENLAYLQIVHKDFSGNDKWGELIVHKDVAQDVVNIFEELYEVGYPIKQMRLVSDFKGSDWQSIEADNTSALNCRPVTGNKKKWSNHAYGKAIDINPIENPYIFRNRKSSHKASKPFLKRKRTSNSASQKAMLLPSDKVTKIFKKYGWKWGGNWYPIKDYQHFSID